MKKLNLRPPGQSLTWKLFCSLLSCLAVLLLIIWLLNNFMLVSYYKNEKTKALGNAYNNIIEIIAPLIEDDADISEPDIESRQKLRALGSNSNFHIRVWQRVNFSTARSIFNSHDEPRWGLTGDQTTILKPGETMLLDVSGSTISVLGHVDNDYYILISTPLAAIEESIDITNRFLILSGAVALVVGIAIVLLIARSFTRPIKTLSRVAASVSRLDFADRYDVKGNDELADLGGSINRMSAKLEHAIDDLTAANSRLMDDIEVKTQQNEAHRAFIANVSHELKTPISLIQTYAEGLREGIAAGQADRDYYCEVIEDEASKMNTLIKKMTLLMQLESGREELIIERFDLRELVRELISKHCPGFELKGITIPVLPDEPLYIMADEFLVENVVTNYITNALHHVSDGGRIEIAAEPLPGGTARITVFNSGNYIMEDELTRIWENFYKTDKARTRAYGGTGIGLSVVVAIMNAHRRQCGVRNRDDGVEFCAEFDMES